MILELTDQQKAFQQQVAEFARDRVTPGAAAIDEQGAFPGELVGELARLGLLGVTIGREWGGAGLDYVSYASRSKRWRAASAVLAVIAAVNNSLVAEPIAEFGTTAQKETWLRRLATATSIGAFALSEEHAGSDAANQQTVARLDDRGYVINGRKVWVANAEAADLAIVFAATQPGSRGRGVSAFLVPMDTPGIDARRARPIRSAYVVWAAWISRSRTCEVETDALLGASGRRLPHRDVGARRWARRDRRAGARGRPGRARGSACAREDARGVRPADRATTRRSSGCSPTARPSSTRRAC